MSEGKRGEKSVPAERRLIEGRIDIEALKCAVNKNGPIRIRRPESGLEMLFSISPCQCGSEDCHEDVIWTSIRHGVTFIKSTVDEEDFLEFESLLEFLDAFFHYPEAFYSSSGDEQLFEMQVEKILGIDPFEIYHSEDVSEAIGQKMDRAKLSDAGFWESHTLVSILRCIYRKRKTVRWLRTCSDEELKDAFEDGREDLVGFMEAVFDMGFLSGRLFSEYRTKVNLEELVEKGERSTHAQHNRTAASGAASSRKKQANLECLLAEIERLGPHFPDISESAILSQAYENAGKIRPMPKSRATKEEYETILRSEEPFKSRYFKVFRKNA